MIWLSKKFLFIYFIAYPYSSMLTANPCRITTITKENGQIIYLLSDWKEESTETHQMRFPELIERLKALEDSAQQGLHIFIASPSTCFLSRQLAVLAKLIESAQKLNLKKSTIENINAKSCIPTFNLIASCYPHIESLNLASAEVNTCAQELFGYSFDKLSFQTIIEELEHNIDTFESYKKNCDNPFIKEILKTNLPICREFISSSKWILEEEIMINLKKKLIEALPAFNDESHQCRFRLTFTLLSEISSTLSSLYIISRINTFSNYAKVIITAENDRIDKITALLVTTFSTLKTQSIVIPRELFNDTFLRLLSS